LGSGLPNSTRSPGTFIRRRADAIGLEREAAGGTWGLLPWERPPAAACELLRQYPPELLPVPMEAFFEPNW
jgi:hypothetical protein